MLKSKSILIKNAAQVVQIVRNKERFVRGTERMKDVCVLQSDTSLGPLNIVSVNGVIEFIGYESEENFKNFHSAQFDETIDASGCSILPGFIDSHTHPVWAGDRVHEFEMKLAGATYMDIHKAGGGIHFTVKKTSEATEEELKASLVDRLQNAMKTGTTFIECKSGYGLVWETELKMLKVMNMVRNEESLLKPGMSITYLGGHAIPKGKSELEASEDIVDNQLQQLDALLKAKQLQVDNIDVFCEKGVFELEQSKRILNKGKEIGLNVNFHGEELSCLNSVLMGVEIGAKGISHLEEISDDEIKAMSASETVGILLPTTAYILRLKQPPARKMIDSGCIVALASDFNPNAYCYSMPLVMHIACINMKMSLSEALIASTINSAFALGVEDKRGSIECGKSADLVILNAKRWEHVIYQMGCHDSLVKFVFIDGEKVCVKQP